MRKIDLYINGDYTCSSNCYRTCREFVDRVKRDREVFVASIPDKIIYVRDGDRVVAHFDRHEY